MLSLVAMAASASKTVYMAPSEGWTADGARFALYHFTGETAGPWVDFTDADADGIFEATFDDTYESMIICRMDGTTTENNWDNKWNQTGDLAAPGVDGFLYTISGDTDSPTVTVSIYGATAATFTDGGKYVLKNIGSGRYLGPGNDWGTQASLILGAMYNTLHVQDGGLYTIESQVSPNGGTQYYFSGSYMDSGNAAWLNIQQVSEGVYVIAPSDNTTSFFGYNGTSFVLASGLTDYTNVNAQWQIVNCDDAIANATAENPVDASFLIVNPNFDRGHRSGTGSWTNPNGLGLAGGDRTNFCVEAYEKTFDFYQTITVPNGYYKVRAQAAVTMHNNRTVVAYDPTACPVIYATSGAVTVTTPFKEMETGDQLTTQTQLGNAFLAGKYITEYSDMLTVTNKSITIGAKSDYQNIWGVFDTFMLEYCGPIDLSGYATSLAEAVAAAEALEGTIPTACYEAIAAVVTENNKTYDNEEDYQAAINAINEAISTYASNNILLAYDRYQRIRTAVLAINADIDVSAADAIADAATTNTGVDGAVPTLRNALTAYLADIEDQEIDVTAALIDNASPGTSGNLDWWTTNQGTGYGNYLFEFYNKTDASSRQTIPATMPVGYYKMTVIGYTRDGQTARMFVDVNNSNLAYQQLVGVVSTTVNNLSQGNDWIAAGNGVNEMIFNLENAAENNLTIGIWGGDQGDKWTAWRSFKLEFLGTAPIYAFDDLLTAAIANGRTTVDALAVPAGVKATFNNYADEIAAEKSGYTTAAQFNTAIDNINAAVEAAREAVAPTAENAFVLAKATAATTELAGLADEDKAALQAVIDGNAEALAACADAAAVVAQNNALWAAIGTAINSITVTDKLDLTFLLTNPNVDEFYTGNHGSKVDGWYTEQDGGNFQVVPGEGCANADGIHKHAYEYWSENPRANNLFLLYQKLQLPEGTYTIDCYAFADQPTGGDVHGVYFYANDTQGSLVETNTLAEQGISFVNDAQQEVKIGLKAVTGNTYRWVGIGYLQLFKVPAKSYAISEDEAYDTETEGAGDVALTRTIIANIWNTIWLPFSMTADELKATFGDDVAIAQFSETVNADVPGQSAINFNVMETPAMSANVPVLLKTSTAGTSYTIEGRTVVKGTPTTAGTNFDFFGTTAAETTIDTGDYFLNTDKLYQSKGATTIKGTRAYLKTTAAGARITSFSIDGDVVTAIENLEQGTITTGKVYNLQGQEVNKAQKGIFIQNGKKVILK